MGSSLSWLALRGKDGEQVCRELGLQPSGRTIDDPRATPFSRARIGEWIVLFSHDPEHLLQPARLLLSSRGAEAVACGFEEHVMFSGARHWRDGQEVWSIRHQAEESREHLEGQGDLPPTLAGLRERALAEATPGVDTVFDIPLALAKGITGFGFDDLGPDVRFEDLEPANPVGRWAVRHWRPLLCTKAIAVLAVIGAALTLMGLALRHLIGFVLRHLTGGG